MHSHRIPFQFPDNGFIHSDVPVLDNDFDLFDLEKSEIDVDDSQSEMDKEDLYDC